MKKIFYIANIRIPTEKAHGVQIMKMCEAFASNGAEVELIIPRRFNKIKDDPFEYYGAKKVFKIRKVVCLDLIHLDFILGNLAFWIQCLSFLAVAKIYLSFRSPGVIYTREQFAGFFFKKFIFEMHSFPEKIKKWQERNWNKASTLLVLTNFIRGKLEKAGVPPGKILVAPDSVDLKQFDIVISKENVRAEKGLPTDKKVILYCGSFFLHGWKGIDILLEAAKFFDSSFLFVLVGGGEKEMIKIKNEYNLSNIKLVVQQPHKEVAKYLKAADILVLPNKSGNQMSEKYTSPLKLFEYMAARRPIVASDLPSIREVLDENNAILVAPDSPEDLAGGIRHLLADERLGDKIVEQAFADVSQKYTWEKRAKNILENIN